jgi:hypothetical protein
MGSMLLVSLLAAALGAAPVAAAPPSAAPAGRVVEAVVAIVRAGPTGTPEVITRTRVEAEARIALVLRGAVAAAFQPLDEGALRAGLAWLLDEWLVAAEAGRLRLQEIDGGVVDGELRRFRAAFGATDEYARFLSTVEVTEDEVREVLARSLRARRFLAARIGPGATVSEDEVDAYLGARGLSAGTGAARDAVREQLAVEGARARVAALVVELRSRAELRILDPALRAPVAGREEAAR